MKRSFSLTNHRQETLKGIYYQPTKSNQQAIIISCGLGSTAPDVVRYVKPLLKWGFTVFTFDFAGFGNSDGQSVNSSVLTEKQDLTSVMKFVKQNYSFKKLDLMGCSQGGLVSALVANYYPRLIRKIILLYPAFCIPADVRHHHIQDVKFRHAPKSITVHGITLGKKYIQDAAKVDLKSDIGAFRRPVLICHGNDDTVAPFKYSEKAYSIYKNAKLVTVKNGDHGFKKHGYDLAMKSIHTFLAMN